MRFIKQSTSIDVVVGPFLDETDGKTAETALTITQPDIRLKKNGGAWAQKNAAQTLSHEENGNYEVTLDATDTDTLGQLRVHIHESGALPVWEDFMVMPANVWDSLFGADKLQVHADEMTAGLITAAAIADNAIDAGAIAADAITSAKVADGALTAAKFAAGAFDAVWTVTTRELTAFSASFKTGYALSSAGVQAIWDALTSALTTVGSIGKLLVDNINATISSRASQTSVDTIDDLVDDLESRVGTPSNLGSGATVAANLVDIEGQTDDIGAAGAGLTAIPDSAGVTTLLSRIPAALFSGITSLAEWLGLIAGKQTGNATARTELRATGAGSGTFDETTDSQEALRDRGDAAWTTATGFSTHSAADVWAVATRTLTAFDASFKTGYALSAAGIQAIWDALTSALTTVGSIGKLLVDRIDAAISSRSSHSAADVWSSATRTLSSAANITSTGGTTVPQTGDSFARLGAPAGASIAADIATKATPAQILTTALTEAYAADGAAPTLSECLFAIQQFLQERVVSGTAVTVKKIDGSTTAMTFTLNDATTPTSITRAS